MNKAIGFVGLGAMGLPMAINLADAGHVLKLYNRTASKAEPLVARGMQLATIPSDVVTLGGVVITVLWDDAALERVVTSEFLERLGIGGVHLSMSTVMPETAERLSTLHVKHGCSYVSAPVFGPPPAAASRKLWVAVSGPQVAKVRIRPLLEAMAQGIFDFGDSAGASLVVKLAGNFLIVSAAHSLMEALSMTERNAVDPKAMVEMLTTSMFSAPIYKTYGKLIAEKTAAISQSPIALRDMELFRRTAEQSASPTPISSVLLRSLTGSARRTS